MNGWTNRKRPTIELELYRKVIDGIEEKVEKDAKGYLIKNPITLNGEEQIPWRYTWEELDAVDSNGNEYQYTVREVSILDDYELL